jgi:hypothetical protein
MLGAKQTARPGFLCIGASRCGTTWLHHNLSRHPELWLPPVKELRFFDHFFDPDSRKGPLVLRDRHSRRRIAEYVQEHGFSQGRPVPKHLGWALRYFFLRPSERWYLSLFPVTSRVCGECSPTYAMLSPDVIQRVRTLLPDVKLIYMCRNPVHRDWSRVALRIRFKHGKPIDEIPGNQIQKHLSRVGSTTSADYAGNLAHWEAVFPPERFFIVFYEEIERDPETLMARLFAFLGVDASARFVPADVRAKLNSAGYGEIPDRYARMLSRRHYENVIRIHERFCNSYTQGWLDYVTEHAGRR